jgi:hypothetical protein
MTPGARKYDWFSQDGKESDSQKFLTGSELLSALEQYIRRYVVLPGAAYQPVALWAIATHAPEQFDCFPYLALVSAVKRSGKTRLAEVLEKLVRRPWRGTAPSPAALYRMLEQAPTLMLDEVETFNGKNKSETTQILLAVLNAGHRKGSTIPRCEGPKQEVKQFNVYGPKLFAAIGRLPDTLMDRSIIVHMKRRTKAQQVERFRQVRATEEAKPMHDGAARFIQSRRADIEQAYQQVLETDLTYLSDRDADLWTPLFAIYSVIDAERLPALKTSALTLSAVKASDDVDDSYALTLLRDIQTVWPKDEKKCPADKCETSVLLEKPKALEESPWLEHQLTARKLARMLKPFEVEPRTLRFDYGTAKGYEYGSLKAAFDPYLEELSVTCVTTQ